LGGAAVVAFFSRSPARSVARETLEPWSGSRSWADAGADTPVSISRTIHERTLDIDHLTGVEEATRMPGISHFVTVEESASFWKQLKGLRRRF
jgi:hypothetical protein